MKQKFGWRAQFDCSCNNKKNYIIFQPPVHFTGERFNCCTKKVQSNISLGVFIGVTLCEVEI